MFQTTNQIMVKNHQHDVMDEPYISYVGPMYWICSFWGPFFFGGPLHSGGIRSEPDPLAEDPVGTPYSAPAGFGEPQVPGVCPKSWAPRPGVHGMR